MSRFPLHTIDSVPEASRPAMEALRTAFGFVPNIAGTMATSPVLISSLVALFGKVHGGTFTEAQIQVLLLTNAVTNGSSWPVALHSALALEQGIDASDVDAVRSGKFPREPKLAALSRLARTLIERRGKLAEEERDAFLDAGFTLEQLLEVIAVIAASTITNYTANVTCPPLEARFSDQAWG